MTIYVFQLESEPISLGEAKDINFLEDRNLKTNEPALLFPTQVEVTFTVEIVDPVFFALKWVPGIVTETADAVEGWLNNQKGDQP